MTENNQNQTAPLESIVGEMYSIAGLSGVVNHYDAAKNPSEQADLLDAATRVLSKGAKPGNKDYENTLAQLEGDGGSAYLKIKSSVDQRAGEISETYKAHKNKILEEVVGKLNKDLEGAKDRVEAVNNVTYAFSQLFNIPEVSQEEADGIATNQLRALTKMPVMTRYTRGNPGEMRDLRFRQMVYEFINETKEGDKATYSINKDKVSELIESPVYGSILYTAKKPEKAKKSEREE